MRWISVMLLLGAVGCESQGDDTEQPTESDPIDDGTHPLVPDEYQYIWNTEGACSNEWGDGDQMHMIFEGRVDAEGNFSGSERVWWFYADEPIDKDCVDTFQLTGTRAQGDPTSLGCSSCDEFYLARRTLTTDNCGTNQYNRVYREDDDGLYQDLMLDTLTANGLPNPDNKIGVFHSEWNILRREYLTKLYANEEGSKLVPEGDEHAPPATYEWIGKRCHISWGRD